LTVRPIARVKLAASGHVAALVQLAVEHLETPAVERRGTLLMTNEIHGVRDERAVSEPRVVIGGKGRRSQVGPFGGLAIEDHGDAPFYEPFSLPARVCQNESRYRHSLPHPLTPPAATPRTNARWNVMKTTMTGTSAISEAANTRPHWLACWPWKSRRAMGNVLRAVSLMIVSAQVNSSQLPR